MLNISKIKSLKPKPKRYTITDAAGLGLEVWPSGVMSWRVRYRLRGKPAHINVGRWPEMSLGAARSARAKIAAAVRAGMSPAEAQRKEREKIQRGATVQAFGQRYLSEVVERFRRNPKTIQRYLERDVYPVIGGKPIAAVDEEELRQIIYAHRDAGHDQAALAVRGVLKRLWDYAQEVRVVNESPVKGIKAKYIGRAVSRTRALSEAEIGLFLRRLDAAGMRPPLKAAFQLILLLLVRKSELRLARWEEFHLDRGEWEIPPEHSKNGKGQIVYLSRQSKKLIEGLCAVEERSGCVFPAPGSQQQPLSASTLNRALNQIQRGMEHFTVHDLRRTASTRLAEMGYNADWIEKALNHTIKGVRGVYNRAQYAEQRRQMLQEWADRVDELKEDR